MRKHHTASSKAQVVQELLKEDKTIAQIAAEYEVHPTQLNKWKSTALQGLSGLFEEKDSLAVLKASHEEQLNKLYAEIGKLTTQVAWLKKNLALNLSRDECRQLVERSSDELPFVLTAMQQALDYRTPAEVY